MLSGRHFLLLGIIACAGLLSVHDGQRQIELCYQIGGLERDLREIRAEIELARIKHRALQSPRAVTTRAQELQLKVGPIVQAEVVTPKDMLAVTTDHARSLGSPQAARRVPAPAAAYSTVHNPHR
ncbi:MAG TPA: hypothetical protein VEK08_04010 [Planctomycetota bacterium]|nr:hypothetical protein [Planctomycetota bacterium]